jgi:hypothetical protein
MLESLKILESLTEKHISSLKENYLFSSLDDYLFKSYDFLNSSRNRGWRYIENFIDQYLNYPLNKKFRVHKYIDHLNIVYSFLVVVLAISDTQTEENYAMFRAHLQDVINIINEISKRLKVDVSIEWPQIVHDAKYLRIKNNSLKIKFKNPAVYLHEHKLSQFDTSKITDKSISQYGLNDAHLIDASFGKDSITIQFEVESTGDNTHVDLTGKTQVFLKRGYSVTIQFTNTDNYLSPTNVNKDAIAQQFNSVIQNCDAKVYCDCPAFYWQGMAEKDAKQGDSYFGFRGQHGTGYWNKLHNVNGPQACKHIWSAIYFINTEQKQICDKLASKVVNSANVYDNIINLN